MLKINNEKARGELIQNPKCQPVLQHFGRGSLGKTGWRYLLYGLQLVCQCSHTSAICFSQTSGTKQFPRCWIWAGSLGAHTSGLRGSTWLPHSCWIPPVCTPQSLLRSAWAALLGFSSDTHTFWYLSPLCVCRQAVHPTVYHTTCPQGLQECIRPWSHFPSEVSRISPPE